MPWTKPQFEEMSLAMEVTAYVNTDAGDLPFAEPGIDDVARRASEEAFEDAVCLSTV